MERKWNIWVRKKFNNWRILTTCKEESIARKRAACIDWFDRENCPLTILVLPEEEEPDLKMTV